MDIVCVGMAGAEQETTTTQSRAMSDDDGAYQVELYVYDLSKGLAKAMSQSILGKQLEGIWHTGVVAYGREYFYGSGGIESCRPGGTILGEPFEVEELGSSQVPYQLFLEYIFGLGESAYKPSAYDLLKNNCNNFSDELAQFLCGRAIPKKILALPDEVLNTSLGETLGPIFKNLKLKDSTGVNFSNNNISSYVPQEIPRHRDDPELDELNSAIEEVRQNTQLLENRRSSLNEKLLKKEKKERKKEKKERKEKRKKNRSSSELVGEKETKEERRERKRRQRLDSEVFDSSEEPSSEQFQDRRHSEPLACVPTDCISRLPPPHPTKRPPSGLAATPSPRKNSPKILTPSSTRSTPSAEIEIDDLLHSSSQDILISEEQIAERFDRLALPSSSGNSPSRLSTPNYRQSASPAVEMEGADELSLEAPEEVQQPQRAPREASPEVALEPEPEREPPILFPSEVDVRAEFDAFVAACAQMLSEEEQVHMEELRLYVVEDEGSWALGEDFNVLFSRIFHDPNIPDDARMHLVRIMASAALKDDVILMLHQDRREHTIMNFANKIESHPPDVQEALALFFCNMFEHLSPCEWLLYISEWAEGGQQISNIRVTTKVAVNALLHSIPKVQEYGTALMYNLGTKEVKTVVFDDVAPELAMAILQYMAAHPNEEFVWRVMTALCRFCYASNEVPQLVKMIGPDPNAFKGMSERVDQVLEEVNTKLSRVRIF